MKKYFFSAIFCNALTAINISAADHMELDSSSAGSFPTTIIASDGNESVCNVEQPTNGQDPIFKTPAAHHATLSLNIIGLEEATPYQTLLATELLYSAAQLMDMELDESHSQPQIPFAPSDEPTKTALEILQETSTATMDSNNRKPIKRPPRKPYATIELLCSDCGQRFTKRTDIAKHMVLFHAKRLFMVPRRKSTRPKKSTAPKQAHTSKNDSQKIDEELYCHEQFEDIIKSLASSAAAARQTIPDAFCKRCSTQFATGEALAKHDSKCKKKQRGSHDRAYSCS